MRVPRSTVPPLDLAPLATRCRWSSRVEIREGSARLGSVRIASRSLAMYLPALGERTQSGSVTDRNPTDSVRLGRWTGPTHRARRSRLRRNALFFGRMRRLRRTVSFSRQTKRRVTGRSDARTGFATVVPQPSPQARPRGGNQPRRARRAAWARAITISAGIVSTFPERRSSTRRLISTAQASSTPGGANVALSSCTSAARWSSGRALASSFLPRQAYFLSLRIDATRSRCSRVLVHHASQAQSRGRQRSG